MTSGPGGDRPSGAWEIGKRVGQLLLVYYVYGGIGYYAVGWRARVAGDAVLLRLEWDDRIPFSSRFVWVYVVHYVLPVLMVVLVPRIPHYRDMLLSFAVVFTLSFAVFIVYPVGVIRPADPGPDLSGRLLDFIYAVDRPETNAFPSLHVAVSVLTALIVWHNARGLGTVFLLAAAGISISTLYVKQHWILDVGAGTLLGAAAYWLVYRGRPLERLGSQSTHGH